MANFDFITDDDLRSSLENDLKELTLCLQASAWKAVHVLAGSIVEATLIDYLVSAEKINSAAAYKTSLAQLIDLCEKDGVLSRKAVDLSTIVREYRNLIHPGRVIRLSERVDEHGATIAKAVIEIVVDEVAIKKKQTYGYTAEQVIRKLEEDSSALSIAEHLFRETRPAELKRLLLKVLPASYLEHCESETQNDYYIARRMRSLYRLGLQVADDQIRTAVGSHYVSILKEEIGSTVRNYEVGLFQSADLRDIDARDRPLVISHFLATMKEGLSDGVLEAAQGITAYLESESLKELMMILVNAMIRDSRKARKESIDAWFFREAWDVDDGDDVHKDKLRAAIAFLEKEHRWNSQMIEIFQKMSTAIDVPF